MTSNSKLSIAAISLAAALAVSGPTSAAPICFQTYLINYTSIKDARTIDFHMRDGTVWRNSLRFACPDLKWWGFAYTLRGTTEVCENLQTIRVIRTDETCQLGSFTKLPPQQPATTHM